MVGEVDSPPVLLLEAVQLAPRRGLSSTWPWSEPELWACILQVDNMLSASLYVGPPSSWECFLGQ